MKKHLISLLCVLLGLVIGAGGYLIYDLATEPRDNAQTQLIPSGEADMSNRGLIERSFEVLACLKSRDLSGLSQFVHPTYGVYFSPYSNINLSSNQWFAASSLSRLSRTKEELVWGVYDGSGEPISLTVEEYFTRFVYDRDYAAAPVISVDRIAKSGNSLENTSELFPDGRFVDLYIPPQTADGIDWSLLRLVYVEQDGVPYLAAIVHSEYTV